MDKNDYQGRLERFQERLEELSIEKELLLNQLFTSKEKLEKIKSRINESRALAENKLDTTIYSIEKERLV